MLTAKKKPRIRRKMTIGELRLEVLEALCAELVIARRFLAAWHANEPVADLVQAWPKAQRKTGRALAKIGRAP